MSTLAHVQDRWEKVVDGQRVRTPRFGNGSRWRARYLDPHGQERSQCFARRVDAERFLASVETTKLHGTYIDPDAGRITLTQFFEDWASRQLWESNTERAMRLALSCSDLGHLPIREIRRAHVEGWIKRMHTNGLAPGTIKTRFTNVRSVLRAAVREHLIVQNPTDDVALPRVRRRAASMTLPTTAQVASIIRDAEPWFRAFISLAAFAGLRLGEAAALKTSDIDHEALTLDVRRQVQRAGDGKVEIRAPKYGSERTVYLAEGLVELLDDHVQDHCPAGRIDWLFGGGADDPPHQNTVGHQWRRACHRAGVEGVTLHDLRHFYASGLIAPGCDVVTVQRALGHAKATTTLNTYAHLWPTAEDRTRQAAAELMADTRSRGTEKVCTAQEGPDAG